MGSIAAKGKVGGDVHMDVNLTKREARREKGEGRVRERRLLVSRDELGKEVAPLDPRRSSRAREEPSQAQAKDRCFSQGLPCLSLIISSGLLPRRVRFA